MTEIREEHLEWATVDRMRQMLKVEHPKFEITQTYTLFIGVLCWTLQHIRIKKNESNGEGSEIEQAMWSTREKLEGMEWKNFVSFESEAPTDVASGMLSMNDFSDFECDDAPFDTLRTLSALRNAVAHGYAKEIIPVNADGKLKGYRLICNESKAPKWTGEVVLNRSGMHQIAESLAKEYCDAFPKHIEMDAKDIPEII